LSKPSIIEELFTFNLEELVCNAEARDYWHQLQETFPKFCKGVTMVTIMTTIKCDIDIQNPNEAIV